MKGFTLLELVFVLVILSIIAATGSYVVSTQFRSYFTQQDITDADWQTRLALERMTRDIQNIPATNTISTAATSQLIFTDANGSSVTYQLTGSNLMRNSQVLARGINTLTFAYLGSNGVSTGTIANIRYISITLNVTQNNVNYTVRTTVVVKNFY
jgi:prepilin-type N-terminal cleavage/methylation domain-containing protein